MKGILPIKEYFTRSHMLKVSYMSKDIHYSHYKLYAKNLTDDT